MYNTIFIVTPSLNSRETIDRTILSVVTQAGDFSIRYHVQDGGSTDSTVERLLWWQRRLASRGFPIQCRGVEFTFASEADKGMYDALCAGFDSLRIPANSFMTWINADDILSQGACALISNVENQFDPQKVSWIGGATSIMRGNNPLLTCDNPIPRSALRAGLCDGIHWNLLRKEGTFFRRWLWTSINPNQTIRPMKLAGDWNLWRLFAQKSSLVQTKLILGNYRIQDDQLSAQRRDKYMAEIEKIIPSATRAEQLKTLAREKPVYRRTLKLSDKDTRISVTEEDISGLCKRNYEKVFGTKPAKAIQGDGPKTLYEGSLKPQPKNKTVDQIINHHENILAYDTDWQFPAVTEQHAYHQLRDLGGIPDGVTYVAYPWANLIDKLQTRANDAQHHLSLFRQFCERLPYGSKRVTVCQHIMMQRYIHLFEEAGISDIFWTHATHQDLADEPKEGITLHPFPLFPVQVTKETDADISAERPFLFSFIGAKSNKYYLTNARELILDLLHDHPEGLIIGRDTWHYNKVVYDHQIRKNTTMDDKKEELVNQSASEQFKASLAQSLFSLCPSGSGPNSIRLWESLGAGSIPVILADTYAPPGNPKLWDQAVVFCEENAEAIQALPARLEEIAKDPEQIARMRHAMRQLWTLYGPHGFVYDVQALMLRLAGQKQDAPQDAATGALSLRLAETLPAGPRLTTDEALMLLRICSGDLLLAGPDRLGGMDDRSSLGQLLILAQETVGNDHPIVQHYRQVVDHVTRHPRTARLAAPSVNPGRGPKIALVGRHSNRTPFAYAPLQNAAGDRITLLNDPMQADVVMTGFNIDIRENADLFETLVKTRADTKVVILSEEPLWDSTWSGGFAERNRTARCGDAELSYTFLNHTTSSIFDFDEVPYFLLTSVDYLSRYGLLIARHTNMTPDQLLEHWKNAPIPAAFYAEVREGETYAKSFPKQALYGLSTYRTEIARKVDLPGVMREGKGWRTDAKRQALPDWHLDKIAALDMRVRVTSAYENTHQRSYISEKIFDAFVVGGVPTYCADDNHRVLNLVPNSSMINTWGLNSDEAAQKIARFAPDRAFAESWLETAKKLQATFTDVALVARERARIVDAILTELARL
jgi:hypothetical protein